MEWVYAKFWTIDMVYQKTFFDLPSKPFVNNPMSPIPSATKINQSIPVVIYTSKPNPTSSFLIDFELPWVFRLTMPD